MRRRLLILGPLAVATMLLGGLGPHANAAPDVKLAFACKLLKSALVKELPATALRLRFQDPVQNYELRCLFTDNGRLVRWKWFAEFLGTPAPSAAAAKRAWKQSKAADARTSPDSREITSLSGYGADNAYALVATDAKREHNSVSVVWQKGVWLGKLTLIAPRRGLIYTDTDEVEELLPVLMRGVPRTYP